MKFKSELLILAGTVFLVLIVFVATSVNIDIKITGKKDQTTPPTGNPQVLSRSVDDMTSHHGGAKAPDSNTFANLVGKPAPDFTLEDYEGKKYNLSAVKGKNILLFFNEGLMCYPACWNQIAAFGKDTEFKSKNTLVLSINTDPRDGWKKAIDKMPELAKSTVLFDTNKAVSTAYGVLTLPSSMHRGEFPGHTYILVDKDGIVRFARDDTQMAVRNKELLAEIAKL